MKIFVHLFIAVASVSGWSYRFPEPGQGPPCELLDLTAKIEVRQFQDERQIDNITIPFDNQTTVSLGECGNETSTSLNLDLNLNGTTLSLNFAEDANKSVLLTPVFRADRLFDNDNSLLALYIQGIDLMSSNKAYKCITEKTYKSAVSNSTTSGGEFQYEAILTTSDLHVQVFNVKDGQFSTEENRCNADIVDTTPGGLPTSNKPATSAETMPSDKPTSSDKPATSPEQSTATSAVTPPSTTIPMPSLVFTLNDATTKEPCIKLELSDRIFVTYNQSDGVGKVVVLKIANDADVGGNCSTNDSTAMLSLKYHNNTDEMNFEFRDENGQSSLDTIEYKYLLDNRFPNASNQGDIVSLKANLTEFTSKDDTYFVCDAVKNVTFQDTETYVELQNFRVQAFNLNQTFTGEGRHCSDDMTSTAVPSTSPTTPNPDNTPSQNNYTFTGNCILIRTGLILTLPYEANDQNRTRTINVPAQNQVNVTGDCNVTSDVQEISLSFFQNWMIKFMFHATDKVTVDDKRAYSLENITVHYAISTEKFPNCVHPGMYYVFLPVLHKYL
ncbi:uncharacterized protein LOC130010740 [Patella vulgata]|uniref:uncharacterized protein LOC130010740 n=1 Tax=Patella vulgata TaxID=6465 RepID=UPI0024A7C3BA|nr:uncharacterized protein LOC130010740 [Patella vulgata]